MTEMNSRERILAAIRHQPLDRVPTDIWATWEVWQKLAAHFGPGEDILARLHIDGMAGIGPRYIGPSPPVLAEGESADFWGIRSRRIDYGSGAYWETSYHPLAQAQTVADLNAYTWPSPDWFDYSARRAQAEAARRTRVVQCGYMAPLYYHTLLRGMETALVDPLLEPEF